MTLGESLLLAVLRYSVPFRVMDMNFEIHPDVIWQLPSNNIRHYSEFIIWKQVQFMPFSGEAIRRCV